MGLYMILFNNDITKTYWVVQLLYYIFLMQLYYGLQLHKQEF